MIVCSDLLEIILLNPAYTTIGNADFIPVPDMVYKLHLRPFMDDKNIGTFFVGLTFNCYGRICDYRRLVQLKGTIAAPG